MARTVKNKTAARKASLIKRIAKRVVKSVCWLLLIVILAITSLRWINPLTSSVMLQHNLVAFQVSGWDSKGFVHYDWTDWSDISAHLPLAVVASEDQRFPTHHGIDTTELRKVIEQGSRRGASTITQQVVKNMFLWQGRSYLRKAIEAVLALYIDVVWGKQRILEIYLNIAYMGDNTYGVGAASQRFFNKTAKQINRFEAARLAAVLPNPDKYSVRNTSNYIVERQNRILKQMKQLGGTRYIDDL